MQRRFVRLPWSRRFRASRYSRKLDWNSKRVKVF
jgi:hypothetical protein